jgi:Icc-related predicted phosphoesterase
LHGHIHEAAGFEEQIGKTKVINVGKEGKILEL